MIPGISRSGATVGMALWRHARPEAAVEFSLLVSVPAILGANLMVWLGTSHAESGIEAGPLLFGFISAFAVGVLSLQALRWLVAQNRFLPFAGYCAALGLGAITVG